jgi:hypothetical protein
MRIDAYVVERVPVPRPSQRKKLPPETAVEAKPRLGGVTVAVSPKVHEA